MANCLWTELRVRLIQFLFEHNFWGMIKEQAKVLIVEDELITAASIAELLEEEDYIVHGIARDGKAAMELCKDRGGPPLVAICDIQLGAGMSGVEVARQLKELHGCAVVFLTAYSDTKTLEAAFETEPVMYVVKPYTDTQLLVAVQMAFHKVYRGHQEAERRPVLQLTEREREVALLVAQGLSSKQISRQLGITVETVKTHRRRMLNRNNINSFPQLVYLLHTQG